MVTRRQAGLRLAAAEWLHRNQLQRILAVLDGDLYRTRAVGGIVRDTLLVHERDETDIDLATELLPNEVIARAQAAGIAAYPTGIDHGTVTLKLGPQLAEVTTLREDVETDGRHAVVRFGSDWRRDAQRRDFTMNALYAGADGKLFDPLEGLADCLAGRVRFIGDPDRRIAEDRLRVYRFFRFSASHGRQHLDTEGLAACRRAAGDLGSLSAERVGQEMLRMLGLARVAQCLEVMAQTGIHRFGELTLGALKRYERLPASPAAAGRLAIMLTEEAPESLQARWRLSNETIDWASRISAAARMIEHGNLAEAAYRYPGTLPQAVAVAGALGNWDVERFHAAERAAANLVVPPFPVSGADLLAAGFVPGKPVGVELARLERDWIESGFALDRSTLLARIRVSAS